jgi:putative DNA primase/helicase
MNAYLIPLRATISGNAVPASLITRQRKDAGSALPEMVALKGIRYAFISEPEKTDKINSGIMKTLTGGNDKCSARGLYQEEMTTFKTQFKLVVCLNELMKIDDTSHGAWRRIRVVEFESLFTEQPTADDPDKPYQFKLDTKITEKFEKWKTVLIAMLVKRACESQGKVPDCDKVMKASKEYEKSQDYLAEFIDDIIIRDPNGHIKKTEINSEFKIWWANNGSNTKANPKELHAKMDKLFGKSKEKKGGWTGVRILYDNKTGGHETTSYDTHSESTNDEDFAFPNDI